MNKNRFASTILQKKDTLLQDKGRFSFCSVERGANKKRTKNEHGQRPANSGRIIRNY